MKGDTVADEVGKVALMKVLFEELRLYVRRQGLHGDKYSYDDLRSFLMGHVAIRDDERAANGSLRASFYN